MNMTKPLKILIADDIVINHMILESILTDKGHEVKCVKNGLAAVEAVQNQDFNVVIMDINMPEMGGKAATGMIRKLPEPKSTIPIIAYTADASEKHMQEYKEVGMNGMIAKPAKKEELLKAIHNCSNGWSYFPQATPQPVTTNNHHASKTLGKLLKDIGG